MKCDFQSILKRYNYYFLPKYFVGDNEIRSWDVSEPQIKINYLKIYWWILILNQIGPLGLAGVGEQEIYIQPGENLFGFLIYDKTI